MVQNSTDDLVAAINTYNGKKYTNNGGSKPKCTFYGMIGHTIDKCYKKHGYPPGWVPGFKSKAKHHGTASVVNNVTDLGVTSGQFQKLMAAIQNQMRQPSSYGTATSISLIPKFNEDNREDSGATDHIACSLETFDEYYVVERDEVSLPTGELCLIQEPLVMTVGLAKQEKGLYHMMKTPLNSILDHRKLVMQLDDFSRFTWLHLMKRKSEAKELIKQFHSFVFTQFGALIKVLRSDNGLEFDMKEFFGDKGIIHQTSCVNTPQQNAVFPFSEQPQQLSQAPIPPLPKIPLITNEENGVQSMHGDMQFAGHAVEQEADDESYRADVHNSVSPPSHNSTYNETVGTATS
ncbi:PREDICTED: uncharacterized protein LOC109166979 [Ipomoea nil]|uniref:uncharacterized protein LOC109166979 n=1 Tax=Ipomoea nil TaxID=35883 RepID=UPI000901E01C|nr:PREDICTED: uncharacterized protein LOC109166979 [Ipomoea nil]